MHLYNISTHFAYVLCTDMHLFTLCHLYECINVLYNQNSVCHVHVCQLLDKSHSRCQKTLLCSYTAQVDKSLTLSH